MSDKGKRGAKAATNGSDGNKFSSALLKITSGFEELQRETDGLQAYEKLCETQAALKQALETQKKEIKQKDEELHDLAKQKDREIAALQKPFQNGANSSNAWIRSTRLNLGSGMQI
jgi:hypothetical protein